MCVLCHMSCGCVSEEAKDFFSPSRVVGGGMLEGFVSKFLLL